MLCQWAQLFCISFKDATRFHINFVLPHRHELNNTGANRLQNHHVLPIFGEFSIINKTYLVEIAGKYFLEV